MSARLSRESGRILARAFDTYWPHGAPTSPFAPYHGALLTRATAKAVVRRLIATGDVAGVPTLEWDGVFDDLNALAAGTEPESDASMGCAVLVLVVVGTLAASWAIAEAYVDSGEDDKEDDKKDDKGDDAGGGDGEWEPNYHGDWV